MFFKILDVLEPRLKRKVYSYSLILLLAVVVDMFTILTLIPVVEFITDQTAMVALYSPYLEEVGGPKITLPLLLSVFGTSAIVKFIFSVFVLRLQSNIVGDVSQSLTHDLYYKYSRQSVGFHDQSNASELIRNLTSEIHNYLNSALLPTMIMFSEVALIIGMGIIIFITDFFSSLFILVVLTS